ncbi:sensor domain-containing diguanylate cyclase [Agrilutibacter solisilvae]|uniref:diguanylate cyclase n=1 Tax=Agrilutibacter solisilvae TaxID=2763317 RepID=A0A975ASB7_9GAMM|nr:GGDEF domain-containing protein [Lysobacter solisilvae]QSX78769.1 GGDEF domain-containing protein [Lysobacter solisilvae]
MSARLLGLALLATVLLAVPRTGGAASQFDVLLDRADAVRSSDPASFQKRLAQLNALIAQASPAQRDRLAYLNAYSQAYAGHFDVAIAQAQRLIETTEDVSLQYRAGALIVNSHAAMRQFVEGLRQLEQMLPLADKVGDPDLRQQGLAVAAVLYNQIGQYELGLRYADQILAAPTSGRAECYAGMLKLEASLHLGVLGEEDAPVMQVIERCRVQHEAVWTNLSRAILARKWAARGERRKAAALLQEHAAEVAATRYPRLIGEIESLQAEFMLAEGDVDGAERHARASIAQSSGMANSLPLVMAHRTLYDIAARRNDPVAALHHYRNYAESDKAYLNDVKARELSYQIVRQETLQKNQQIELLNRRNEVLELEKRVDRAAARNTQLIAALLATLLAFIGYFAYKTKRMQMSFRRLAETDALTGISNRHHFTRQAEEALAFCARSGQDVGLIMFDLDHFKQINDLYGHVTGDFVLRQVAQACRACCRRNDRIGRIGGEEFAILLIGADLAAATRMAQVCCEKIAAVDTQGSGHTFGVSASFGVTTASLSGYDLTRLLSHADGMLYCSKREGRNRVSVYCAGQPEEGAELARTA